MANSEAGILLTSYDQLRLQRSVLLPVNWGYAILDEGHKIRNPDAEVRLALGCCDVAVFHQSLESVYDDDANNLVSLPQNVTHGHSAVPACHALSACMVSSLECCLALRAWHSIL